MIKPVVIENKNIQLTFIGLIASLMGIGQNGLLVSLPFLIEQSAFSLPAWSIVIAIGSFLFLPAAPFWGRFSDRNGPKTVVVQALVGMSVSFFLLWLFTVLSRHQPSLAIYCLVGLIAARVVYGCTVAGMVPASQHWAIILCGAENRLKAITSVSIGLSTGRLAGPLLSILLLKVNVYAPLLIMIVFPLVALMCSLLLPKPKPESQVFPTNHPVIASNEAICSRWQPLFSLWPFLLSGLLLCAVIALLQYSFSPLIGSVTKWTTDKISDSIGVLLTISAAVTLLTQVLVIKKKKLDLMKMFKLGAVCLTFGFIVFLGSSIWAFPIGMAISSFGAALLVPAYTSMATQTNQGAPGVTAGYISMSHTLGYGLASLLAVTSTLSPSYPIAICVMLSFSIVIISRLKKTIQPNAN
ncbi:MFS transporter [Vibrio genomosp. F10 str. 9ZC157]|uniref:Permease n=1 Tax=Vibrio genomosp. F10 str. ZF-129 TaxID=1187848 RepID=A0A1E5BAR4_9VIBR|nr:MFS transporter [Vibrio genomosp. F10]OEE31152.1 permease [Vibrio genomosp. F10 str. ZF-129]OEE97658.1 permease [Vibrio genomosp. F10 str. 9ZC157]